MLVAINKNDSTPKLISNLRTSLPAGTYTDYLAQLLGGGSIQVTNGGGGGNNPVPDFTLPAHSVAVWTYSPASAPALALASVGPDVAQPGVQVTLAGSFAPGVQVRFGSTTASIIKSERIK